MAWSPAEVGRQASGVGYEHGRIAGPGRLLDHRERMTRDAPDHCYHLVDRCAGPGADVVGGGGRAARCECLQRQDVRLGQVNHVDIVTNGGAVRRGVVGAEHLHGRSLGPRGPARRAG